MKSPLINDTGIQGAYDSTVPRDIVRQRPQQTFKRLPFPSLFVLPGLLQLFVLVICVVPVALMCTVFKEQVAEPPLSMTQREVLEYASIPLVSVAFTYVHIWLALWLTFYPVNFIGCWRIPYTNVGFPMGWQGIVPFKAEAMARRTVKLMTENLIDIEEIFARLDPQEYVRAMAPALKPMLRELVSEIANQHSPEVWEALPESVKEEVIAQAEEESPAAIIGIMKDFKVNIKAVFGLEEMVVKNLMADVEMLDDIFICCGSKELCFIRNSGAWMGLIFGIIQMCAWRFFHPVWFLPVFGTIVGAGTNWIALKMIFSPVDPVKVGCCTLQGLFLKRQQEVACKYSKIVSERVLNMDNFIAEMVMGPTAEKIIPIVHKHVMEAYDNVSGSAITLVRAAMGKQFYDALKQSFCEGIVKTLPVTFYEAGDYMEEVLKIEETLKEEMTALTPTEFEQLLHPVFQEDEWKLILMGGVLGAAIGAFQTYAL